MALIVHTTPARGYEGYINDMRNLYERTNDEIAKYASTTNSREVLRFQEVMIAKRDFFNTVAALSGIVQYARDQRDDQGYDIVVEHNATMTNLEAAIDFVANNFPASTYLSFDANDNPVYADLSPAQLSGLVTLLQAFVGGITIES